MIETMVLGGTGHESTRTLFGANSDMLGAWPGPKPVLPTAVTPLIGGRGAILMMSASRAAMRMRRGPAPATMIGGRGFCTGRGSAPSL